MDKCYCAEYSTTWRPITGSSERRRWNGRNYGLHWTTRNSPTTSTLLREVPRMATQARRMTRRRRRATRWMRRQGVQRGEDRRAAGEEDLWGPATPSPDGPAPRKATL
ncbi:hypothetical protein Q1695_009234 [Nippostrongylus brasiliensis]|nr:hypothetical protein Q1695_009234 [Nippostrongylus brasiliensis]